MPNCARLIEKARNSPGNLRFAEVCQLAECCGYEFVRQRGSHRIYKAPGRRTILNLQELDRGAKPYQVRQILAVLDNDENLDGS